MIRVAVAVDEQGALKRISSSGHAAAKFALTRGAARYNAVCAALSMIEQNFCHAAEIIAGAELKVKMAPGIFEVEVLSAKKPVEFSALSKALLLGYQALSEAHPAEVELRQTGV